MIIVEGPDGAGKTTLVNRLTKDWEIPVVQRSVTHEAQALVPIDEYIDTQLKRGFGWRMYDRFALISSPCYAMLPNRTFSGMMFNPNWLRQAYRTLNEVNPAYIYCMPPLDVVKANVMGDPDNVVVEEHIETIYINYLAYISRSLDGNYMVWNYTDPWNEHRIQNLMAWARTKSKGGH